MDGTILSLHASKGDANSAASKVLTPQAPTAIKNTLQTSGGKRKRKANKKLFDNDYITDESESVSEPAPVQKSKGNSKNKGKKNRTGEAENKHRGGEKASPAKKRKTLEEKEQELSLLSAKLTDIEENILRPVVEIDSHSSSDTELSESESSRIEEPTLLGSSTSLSGSSDQDNQPKLQHPHFGGKRPKSNRPPPRCINCDCKREKQEKDHEIETLKEEVQQLQKELRMLREQNQSPNKQIEGNEGSGKMSKEQGNARGLIELVSGSGVWTCANKLGAAIKDAENKSRTVLVRSLVAIFFSKEQLLSKSFSDLDKDIIEACVEFAMIAKLGKVDSVKKSQLRQALRCKVNSMKFQSSRPGYYQEYRKNYSGPKKAAKEAKEE